MKKVIKVEKDDKVIFVLTTELNQLTITISVGGRITHVTKTIKIYRKEDIFLEKIFNIMRELYIQYYREKEVEDQLKTDFEKIKKIDFDENNEAFIEDVIVPDINDFDEYQKDMKNKGFIDDLNYPM